MDKVEIYYHYYYCKLFKKTTTTKLLQNKQSRKMHLKIHLLQGFQPATQLLKATEIINFKLLID